MAGKPILFSGPMILALLAGTKTQTRRGLKFQPAPGINIVRKNIRPFDADPYHSFERRSVYGNYAGELDIKIKRGDRLYVCEEHYRYGHWETSENARTKQGRQKWHFVEDSPGIRFEAPEVFRKGRHHHDPATPAWHKRLGRFMFRKHSRLTLVITDVRVMRMQDITDADAIAEGATYRPKCRGDALEDIGWSMDWGPVDSGKVLDIDHCLSTAGGAFLNYFHTLNKFPKKYGDDPSMWPNPWVAAYTFRVIKSNIDRVST